MVIFSYLVLYREIIGINSQEYTIHTATLKKSYTPSSVIIFSSSVLYKNKFTGVYDRKFATNI